VEARLASRRTGRRGRREKIILRVNAIVRCNLREIKEQNSNKQRGEFLG
jgi:hypothetical protein